MARERESTGATLVEIVAGGSSGGVMQVNDDTGDPTSVGYGATDLSMPTAPEQIVSTTATPTFVADSTSETEVLSANNNRVGASLQNTSSGICYVLCKASGTASASLLTARLAQYDYWETPFGYVGPVRAVWATDPGDGGLAITEFV